MQEHELVVIDAAASYNGYTADITRTYALGSVEDELEKIYKIVLEAQKRGIAAAVAGATGKDVDQASPGATSMTPATGNTSAMGLATGSAWKSMKCVSRNFCLARRPWKTGSCTRLNQASTCRKAGVRIEDDILVNGDTPEVLSTLPKDELIHL